MSSGSYMFHSKEVGQALGLQFSQISTVFAAKVMIEHDKLTAMIKEAISQMGPSTNVRSNGKLRGMIQLGEERLQAISEFTKQYRKQYGLESDADRIDRILAAADRLDVAITEAKRASDSNQWEQERAAKAGQPYSSPARYASNMGVHWNQPAAGRATSNQQYGSGRGTLSPPLDSSPLAAEPQRAAPAAAGPGGRPRGFLRDPMDDEVGGRPSVAFGSNMRGAALQSAFGMAQNSVRAANFDDVPVGTHRERTPPRSTRSGGGGYDDVPVGRAAAPPAAARNLDDVPVGRGGGGAPRNLDDVPVGGGRNAPIPLDEVPVGAVRRGGIALDIGLDSHGSEPPQRAGAAVRAPPSRFQRPASSALTTKAAEVVTVVEPPKRGPPASLRARLEARTANAVVPTATVADAPPRSDNGGAVSRDEEVPRSLNDELPLPTSGRPIDDVSRPAAAAAASALARKPPGSFGSGGVRSAFSTGVTGGSRFYSAPRHQNVTLQSIEDVLDFESECRMELFATARAQLLEIIAQAMHDAYVWHRRIVNTERGVKERPGRLTVTPTRSEYSIWSFVVVAPVLLLIGAFIVLPIYTAMRKVVG